MNADREQIQDLMNRYGLACDTENWELLSRCVTQDVLVQYGSFEHDARGSNALEAYLRSALEPLDGTQHFFTNFLVDIDGAHGHFRCLMQAQHLLLRAEKGSQFLVAGEYENDVERTADGWKISRLKYTPVWMSGNPEVLGHILKDNIPEAELAAREQTS